MGFVFDVVHTELILEHSVMFSESGGKNSGEHGREDMSRNSLMDIFQIEPLKV